jgi:hypothetical protein
MPERPRIPKEFVYKNKHTGEVRTFRGAFYYRGFENDWEIVPEGKANGQ